ncbi:omega-3 polyunsaturated fatty acid synthase subunit, PfaB / omega-3 polyunsaturated fatty acid synthase subunit, PfaC [Olavius algarvensis Delta 1 endosymbiont]|nr:omega-3 polyunsaturated fatty acid synthase subunit, PfaB / omega-3 polyunsaturated fatty acid synthase subunit, PfaC [Olavius algarvensis Delta 1 endosymbiont]
MNPKNPIAVVGMAGLFPAAATLDVFWQNIVNQVDATADVRRSRWGVDPESMVSPIPQLDKAYSKRCCHIGEFEFDPAGLDLDKNLIQALDPLYHIVLHVGREALGAIPDQSLNRNRTGVILAAIALPTDSTAALTREILGSAVKEKLWGGMTPERDNTADKRFSPKDYPASRVTSLPGAILARALGLGGGTCTLDAACASSLYSVKLACDELHSRRADVMLAGGVSRPNSLFTQVGFSQLKALSPSGRCAPFDKSADGLVVGEGAGMVVLKRLADAVRDGDTIHGLIKGVGLSNDMRGNLLAPDSEGQLRAMRQAYNSCGWSPQDVDLIECHGAGTPLGDLTELNSLKTLWGDSGWTRAQCSIGSVKSMIGHLLTAAGAAGMLKTLLALGHATLPPSLNFNQAPVDSPLTNGPFRVQTECEPWPADAKNRPRRAAVSAFGFGGINAHMLLEEWDPIADYGLRIADLKTSDVSTTAVNQSEIPKSKIQNPKSDIAIVGLAASFGSAESLRDFQELVFNGQSNISERPRQRWKGCDRIAERQLGSASLPGGYGSEVLLKAGQFHIPPNEIPDILPQQLLMLKVAAGAMLDAALPLRQDRPAMGAVIGIDFDLEATNFQLRWQLSQLIDRRGDDGSRDYAAQARLDSLKDICQPPLSAPRTLGALGGIVASRLAREFRLGGPSFAVSCEDAGGLKALEIGARALQQKEAESFLIGAVDLSGDVRNIMLTDCVRPFSRNRQIRPFDKDADGALPGDGAAALIIKRLDRVLADGDRIYAVIKGFGGASGGGIDADAPTRAAYTRSLERCCREARISPAAISYVETHGSGRPAEDDLEATALNDFFSGTGKPCAVGSVKPTIGSPGAASALASVVKTSLCLYQEILPPLGNFTSPKNSAWLQENFHFPIKPQYWLRDRSDGPRTALVGSMTPDGNCMHAVLEGFDYLLSSRVGPDVLQKVKQERQRPLGLHDFGLFCIEGSNRQALLSGLDALNRHLENFVTAAGDQRPRFSAAIEEAARAWYLNNGVMPDLPSAVSIAAADFRDLKKWIGEARDAIEKDTPRKMGRDGGIHYSPQPLGRDGQLAFVFPGSGNHYLGMGRDTGVQWPQVLRDMDSRTSRLATQLLPECYAPWRISWETGWQADSYQKIISDPHHMIFGQVVHGGVMANLVKNFGIRPSAVIGYSLGESAGYFAMDVWPERGEMLERMQATNLFSTELAGPCNAARRVWGIPAGEAVNWSVAVVNRSADTVQKVLKRFPTARLLIINTPEECVIGGRLPDVQSAVKDLSCEAIFLDGVVTVHCDTLKPVADAYRDLHVFPTTQPDDIRFYSCALGRAYTLTDDKAANSILNQALHGFDFTATVNRAYQDGVRVFLELGPYSSCTRMTKRTLHQKSHLALSACVKDEQDHRTVIKVLAALLAERIPVDLAALYGRAAYAPALVEPIEESAGNMIKVTIGGGLEVGSWKTEDRGQRTEVREQRTEVREQRTEDRRQRSEDRGQKAEDRRQRSEDRGQKSEVRGQKTGIRHSAFGARLEQKSEDRGQKTGIRHSALGTRLEQKSEDKGQMTDTDDRLPQADTSFFDMIDSFNEAAKSTAEAHQKFLELSNELTKSYAETFKMQTDLLQQMLETSEPPVSDHNRIISESERAPEDLPTADQNLPTSEFPLPPSQIPTPESDIPNTEYRIPNTDIPQSAIRNPQSNRPVFSREDSLEFAIGSAARVLGPEFAAVDSYEARVRLPDEPLMLVDRILAIEGAKGALGSGSIVTEHDVLPGAWYLDGGRAPVCISVEAGQADLFLCAYLGIDLKVQGRRTYRLLDATVKFHRGLPLPGETIRYEIAIEKFLRQGDTYLFLFHFNGFIDNTPLITMTNGCAGFFTDEEVKNSGGIILTPEDRRPRAGKRPADWENLVPLDQAGYDDSAIQALREGRLAQAFGRSFEGLILPDNLRLPGGRMKLIDRVINLDPSGGQFGLGLIQAEADIDPQAWYLTCHFVDDMVMPGTLMYECCAHTLRIYLQRIGWVTEKTDVFYEPVREVPATLKCRGPVTPATARVVYEIEIKEIGYRPEPYVIADAYMYADGQRIVFFRDMSLQMSGLIRDEIESLWRSRISEAKVPASSQKQAPLFDRRHLLEFAEGRPSKAFGDPYAPYDAQRFIARLPRPPYLLIDRIVKAEPAPWVLHPDGWIEAECDIAPDAWYFKAERTPAVPISILLEIALQPCGWLAAYMGSALRSKNDLRFRNLGGSATVFGEVLPDAGTLTVRARLTNASEAADMVIEHFDFEVYCRQRQVYAGKTYFGFFTRQALAQQEGIRDATQQAYTPAPEAIRNGIDREFGDQAPLDPGDPALDPAPALALPAKSIRMIDRIELYIPDGGPNGLGFVRGTKTVDPTEWFFKAHFYQDPVCPGSLGIESFIQLLKFVARERWPQMENSHRFGLLTEVEQTWIYRGQILPENNLVTVEAAVTKIQEAPLPAIQADGYLKVDELPIYKMENFGIRLIPVV